MISVRPLRWRMRFARWAKGQKKPVDEILPAEYKEVDYYPESLQKEIDEVGKWIQDDLNTGVYKAGFAPDQETYDKNVVPVFGALNRLEEMLAGNGGPFILGTALTELDLRLYPTLIRFDTIYVQHFKCNLGTIRHDYPLLNEWMKNLYWKVPGFKDTTDFRHIKENVSTFHFSDFWKTKGDWGENADGVEQYTKAMRISILRLLHPWDQYRILRAGLRRAGVRSRLVV
jgi:hypothetical protein